jgi:VWFA-related protein
MRRGLSLVCGAIALTAELCAQQPSQPPAPTPSTTTTLSVSTHEVLLDVLVTDASGHPVTGLKPANFAVTEEGDPQSLKSLVEHHPMSAADVARLQSAPALPPNTYTNFTPIANTNASTVILLDALDTPVPAQMYLRQQLIAYLKNMPPGTSVAIFQLDTQLRLIQGLSSDRSLLLAAAESRPPPFSGDCLSRDASGRVPYQGTDRRTGETQLLLAPRRPRCCGGSGRRS